jgi:N-formylglutamate deformylase
MLECIDAGLDGEALRALIEQTRSRHGRAWHLNLHSMPSNAYERLGLASDRPLADVVLGDLRGVSCSAAFMRCVAEAFESDRKLYLDEGAREPSARFERMRQDVAQVLLQVARFVRAEVGASSRSPRLKEAS